MAAVDGDTRNQFKEFCNVNDDVANQFLQHCDGNLETAVQLFFQTGGTLQNSREGQNNADNELRERRRTAPSQQPARSNPNARSPRQVAVPQPGWLGWLMAILRAPIQFTFTTLWEILSFAASLFIPGATPAVTDARGDVDRFIQFYTDRMMDNADHIIQFFHGSYNEALKRAKDELKVLIVYLHDPNAPDARRFITESLNSAEFNEIIQANGAIVFGVAIDSPEGRSVSMQLRPRSYPFVGVIAQGMSGAMTLTLRVEGFIDAVGLSTNLRLTIADVNAQLNVVRQQRLQREADKLLREEQEREYRESAEKDRKKIQERRRLESEKQAAEDAEKQKAAMEASRREAIKAQRDSIKARLGEEPKSGDVVRVQVRFASGAKFDRRFLADDSLEELFNAILCQEACPDFFTLHSNFPRKEIFCAPEWYHNLRSAQLASQGEERAAFVVVQTFRAAGIEKSVALMVQDCMA